jgi:hypothetical protein
MTIDERATEEFFAHYGVPGMRWGVRNDKKPSKRKQAKLKKYGSRKKGLTSTQRYNRIDRMNRRIAIGTGAVTLAPYAVVNGLQFLESEKGQKLLRTSGRIWRTATFSKTTEEKIGKYIRNGPPPSSFIDVNRVDGLTPWKK